ncbi:MAG: T9SS type A sorting domain-containing protein [Chitinophagales bacterium]
MRFFIFSLLLFFSSISLIGQTTYQKTYGTSSTDEVAFGGVSTESGDILLLNRVQSSENGTYDMQLLRLDKDGEQLWSKDYPTADFNEEILNLYALPSGGYLLTARLKKKDRSFGGLVIQVDALGEIIWMNTSDLSNKYLIATAIGENGDFVFLTLEEESFHLLAMDNTQNIVWEKELSDSELTLLDFNSIAAASDGGYILSGTGHLVTEQDRLMLLYKVDGQGNREWYRLQAEHYADSVGADSNTPQGEHVIQTNDGGYLHIGRTNGWIKRMVYRTDSNGETIWYAEDGSSTPDRIDVIERTDGGFLIVYGERLYSSRGDISHIDADGNVGSYKVLNSGLMGLIPTMDESGDFYAFGDSGRRSLDMDAALFYCNANREVQWSKTFGQTGNKHEDTAIGMVDIATSNDMLVFGQSDANTEGQIRWKLLNINKQTGILNWEKQLVEILSYSGEIISLTDGNFLVSGIAFPDIMGNIHTRYMKINANGDSLWVTDIERVDTYRTITETENGEILIVTRKNFQNLVLIKLGNDGQILSEVNLPSSYDFLDILYLGDGDNRFILVGNASGSMGSNGTPMVVMEMDSNGTIIWQTLLEDDSSDFKSLTAKKVLLSQSGKLLVVGQKSFDNSTKNKIHLSCLSTDGNIQWEKDIAELDKSISVVDLLETPSGNIAVLFNSLEEIYRANFSLTGLISRTQSSNILQTDANGELIWSKKYGSDIGYGTELFDFKLAENGGFIAVGYIDYQNSRDIYVFKTDEDGLLTSISPLQKNAFDFRVFPNPSSGNFQIQLSDKSHTPINVSIFDSTGKKHFNTKLIHLNEKLNLSSLPKGIYLLQLSDGEQFVVERLVIE